MCGSKLDGNLLHLSRYLTPPAVSAQANHARPQDHWEQCIWMPTKKLTWMVTQRMRWPAWRSWQLLKDLALNVLEFDAETCQCRLPHQCAVKETTDRQEHGHMIDRSLLTDLFCFRPVSESGTPFIPSIVKSTLESSIHRDIRENRNNVDSTHAFRLGVQVSPVYIYVLIYLPHRKARNVVAPSTPLLIHGSNDLLLPQGRLYLR